jgi:enamine deaminase RidA (YjgF/YER057c/UK114 family)
VKTFRNPDTIHPPLAPYSHQVEITGERLLVMAGQLGMRADGSLAATAAEQLDLALANVLANLEAADMEVGDLVKLTLYFVEEIDAPTRGGILARRLGEHRPAMTLVYVARLAAPPLLVEVDAWASGST